MSASFAFKIKGWERRKPHHHQVLWVVLADRLWEKRTRGGRSGRRFQRGRGSREVGSVPWSWVTHIQGPETTASKFEWSCCLCWKAMWMSLPEHAGSEPSCHSEISGLSREISSHTHLAISQEMGSCRSSLSQHTFRFSSVVQVQSCPA